MFLGIISQFKHEWVDQIQTHRNKYEELVAKHSIDPRHSEGDVDIVNPLSTEKSVSKSPIRTDFYTCVKITEPMGKFF